MQIPTDLAFFQDLFQRYYEFTLQNSVYAICLAVAVWLLVVIFYSLKIAMLKGRHQATVNAGIEVQNQLTAAQEQIAGLGADVAAAQQKVDEESQRVLALEERNKELAADMAVAVNALAAEPDLAQQGLSIKEGLEIEQIWQRYNIAVKQLCEKLLADTATIKELQQAQSLEVAKLAEKDLQLQAAQLRIDSQKQQHAKLEVLLEEQKALHQTDLARLAELQQQAQEWQQNKASATVAPAKDLDQWVKEREQEAGKADTASQAAIVEKAESTVAQVESKAVAGEVKVVEPVVAKAEVVMPEVLVDKPKPVNKFTALFTSARDKAAKPDDKSVSNSRSATVEVETPREVLVDTASKETKPAEMPPVQPTQPAETKGNNKFTSLFASAREKINKLDQMLGDKPVVAVEEIGEQLVDEAKEILVDVRHEIEEVAASTQQAVTDFAKEKSGGLGGMFKNPFAGTKEHPAAPTVTEIVETVEPQVEVVSQEVASATKEGFQGFGSKFKNLLGSKNK